MFSHIRPQDESLHDVIQVASTTILSYLEHVGNRSDPEDVVMQDIETATSALRTLQFSALSVSLTATVPSPSEP